jgi:SAM-dependent methyltransferase
MPGESTSQFTGSLPANYDRLLGPILFEPYARDLASRLDVPDGGRVLELACGTGIATRHLREAMPDSATLVATDLNQPMVDHARVAVPAPGIEWQAVDAQELPFGDGEFDAVVCQFGVMFLPDKVAGYREALRVLRPGGVFLTNVWRSPDENVLAGAMERRLAELFPDDPPRFLDTPYGYHDRDRIRAEMAAAGWERVELTDVDLPGETAAAADVANGFSYGTPLSHDLAARGADVDAVVAQMADALAAAGGERPFRVLHAAIVIRGER